MSYYNNTPPKNQRSPRLHGSGAEHQPHAGKHATRDDPTERPWRKLSAKSYLKWGEDFIKALFDFSFSEVVTVKMLPLLYGLAIAALLVTLCYITIETMLISPWRGLVFLLIINPVLFIFGTAAIRTVLEFSSSIFRIQSLMINMNHGLKQVENSMDNLVGKISAMDGHLGHMSEGIDDMKTNFDSVTRVVENLDGMADKIPFMKKTKRDERKNWAESSISERFQYSTRSFYKIEE